jgi:hypothetical protein
LDSTNEPLSVRRHLCFCGFECGEAAPEVPHPMGKKQNQPFQMLFNASLKVDFQGLRVTSDAGLILSL